MNALTTKTETVPVYSLAIMDPVQFEHMQRVGKMLALSPLFPEHLRKGGLDVAIANGVLVINMAMRLREDPLTVAQNIYFVGGKPGWMTTYLIAKANQHGAFDGPIDWKTEGKGADLSVMAYATLSRSGRVVSVVCDMALARAEGWTSNKKYSTMPEQMLRYRSATWLIRLYCPEVLVGVPAAIDHDLPMRDVTPDEPMMRSAHRVDNVEDETVNTETGEVLDGETVTDKQAAPETKKADPTPTEEAKAAPAPKEEAKTEAAPKEEVKPAPAVNTDKLAQHAKTILRDLSEAGRGNTNAVLEMYEMALNDIALNAPDLMEKINNRAAAIEAGEYSEGE